MITKPPSRKKIEELINKGGSSPKKGEKKDRDALIVTTPLRIPKGMLEALDNKIKSPYGGKITSRNAFIVNAIIKALDK